MRRSFLVGVSLLVLVEPSQAADLPITKAPVAAAAPSPVASWAGFYLGLNGGYGWAKDRFSDPVSVTSSTLPIDGVKGAGALYGAHAGYNWQFGRLVTGAEVDFNFTDIKGNNGVSASIFKGGGLDTETVTQRESIQYLSSARGRVGWLPADGVLLYGTAGLAWERLDRALDDVQTSPGFTSIESGRNPSLKLGWVAGLGVEFMLGNPNWIGRLEYLHYDLGTVSSAFSSNSDDAVRTAGSQTVDVIRAGLSYKFGEAARFAPAPYAKAPVMTASTPWAGFYIGAHGGYGWGNDPFTEPMAVFTDGTDILPIVGTNSKGWVGGGQFGHNWQYDRVVTGLEADFSATHITGSTTPGVSTTEITSFEEKAKYLGTLRGRLGWLPVNNVLLYGTAGMAWERFERTDHDFTNLGVGTVTTQQMAPTDLLGWVAGVGAEFMLGSTNWIGRLEYLHYDFSHAVPDLTFGSAASSSGHQTIDLVRAGVSYKFGPDAPMTASVGIGKAAAAPMQNWKGLYVGAHGGYGWSDNDLANEIFFAGQRQFGGIKSEGALAGGQFGYNWQYGSAVAGFEIDGSASALKGRSQPGTFQGLTVALSDDVRDLATVRARVGWAPVANWLVYATGGLGFEQISRTRASASTGVPLFTSVGEGPRDNFGWVAGAGVETFIGTSNWIARLEYLHYDFATVEVITSQTVNSSFGVSGAQQGGHQGIDTVRAGLSYKFNP